MTSMRFLVATALALLCLLLTPSALADICIGKPTSIAIGESCSGSSTFCRKGSYCNYLGVCTALIKVGGNCSNPFDACVSGARCLGSAGSMICVQNVGLGSPCSTNATNTIPFCDPAYSCSGITQLCTGGYPGDACQTPNDCSLTNCTSGVCSFYAVGQSCFTTLQCAVGSYCTSVFPQGVCTALPTTGATCTASPGCTSGNYCIGNSPTATQLTCVAQGSLAAGSYCGTNSAVCKNSLCYNGYCASNPPRYCGSDAQCGLNMVCQCGGDESLGGYGYCSSASCVSQSTNFYECASTKCLRPDVGVGTCANSSCLSQYNSFNNCNSASSLFVSFSFIAFVAFLAAFFSKEF